MGIGKSQLEAENPSLVQIPEAPTVQMVHPRSGSRFVLLGLVWPQLWLGTLPWKREGNGGTQQINGAPPVFPTSVFAPSQPFPGTTPWARLPDSCFSWNLSWLFQVIWGEREQLVSLGSCPGNGEGWIQCPAGFGALPRNSRAGLVRGEQFSFSK